MPRVNRAQRIIKETEVLRNSINALSKKAVAIFLAQLSLCAYCILTLAGTQDTVILIASERIELPFVKIGISPDAFFFAGPFLVWVTNLYLAFYLHPLRSRLEKLRTMGKDICWTDYVHPWLYNMVVLGGKGGVTSLFWFFVASITVWILPIFTNGYFFWFYSAMHSDWIWFHAFFWSMTAFTFWIFEVIYHSYEIKNKIVIVNILFVIVCCLASFLSVMETFNWYRNAFPGPRNIKAAEATLSSFPSQTEIAAKLSNIEKIEKAKNPEIDNKTLSDLLMETEKNMIRGYDLRKKHLEFAELYKTNMRKAMLNRANLKDADLFRANLQDAILYLVNLQGADLKYANLQGAKLWDANLQGADLKYTNLQGAEFFRANLKKVDLREANLLGARIDESALQSLGSEWSCKRWVHRGREFWEYSHREGKWVQIDCSKKSKKEANN